MSKPTIEQQIFDELTSFASKYQVIPEGAQTIEQLRAAFPQIPHGRLEKWLGERVRKGEWFKERRGNVMFYWPAK